MFLVPGISFLGINMFLNGIDEFFTKIFRVKT